MKFLATPLTTLVLCLGVLGATIQVRQPSGSSSTQKVSAKDKCPTAQVVTTQTINIGNGLSINRTTFACPDQSLRQASQTPPPASKQIPTNVVGKRDSIFAAFEKRNAVECRTPAPECQCGQDFSCSCQNVTAQAPASSDCAILIDSTQAIAQAAGPTFLVQPDNFELVTFGTCALEWTNFGCDTLEYCWDELGSTAGVVNQLCFEQGGGTAAACNADDDLWLLQALRVGS